MQTVTIDSALDYAMLLPIEDRDELVDILRKRLSEEHRLQNAQEMNELVAAYHRREITSQPLENIIADLDTEFAKAE